MALNKIHFARKYLSHQIHGNMTFQLNAFAFPKSPNCQLSIWNLKKKWRRMSAKWKWTILTVFEFKYHVDMYVVSRSHAFEQWMQIDFENISSFSDISLLPLLVNCHIEVWKWIWLSFSFIFRNFSLSFDFTWWIPMHCSFLFGVFFSLVISWWCQLIRHLNMELKEWKKKDLNLWHVIRRFWNSWNRYFTLNCVRLIIYYYHYT